MLLKDLARVLDRFFRFFMVFVSILIGMELWIALVTETTPVLILLWFFATVAAFGLAYWWMFNSKSTPKGW